MRAPTESAVTEVMLQRICGEFLEMPGLRLTSEQAQRLWGLDEPTCLELLDTLVEAKFLSRTGNGTFSRATDGFANPPRFRMAKAGREMNPQSVKKAG